MKLMSKLRTHANLRLNAGFDLSPVSLQNQHTKKQRNKKLSLAEEASAPARNIKDPCTECPSRNDNEALESLNPKDTVSSSELESRKISKDLKSKLCLTDRIMGKSRKDQEKSSKRQNDTMSPRVTHIFRWKSNEETSSIPNGDRKNVFRSIDSHVSYENPTFRLDSSLDSSVSGFLFESEHSDHVSSDVECKDAFSKERPCTDTGLTVVLDSVRSTEDEGSHRAMFDKDRYLECNRNYHRPVFTNSKARSLSVNDVVLQEEEEESASCLELNTEDGASLDWQGRHADDLATLKGRKSSEKIRKTSVCSSKSCRIRTVDNITNFWTNARGGSFRSKVSVGRKKSVKDSREHESMGQDRVLVTTTSGSSTRLSAF